MMQRDPERSVVKGDVLFEERALNIVLFTAPSPAQTHNIKPDLLIVEDPSTTANT